MRLSELSSRELVQELVDRRNLAEASWFDFCEAAYYVVKREAWTAVGYVDPIRFFEDQVQVKYRRLRRALTNYENLLAVSAEDQPEARAAMIRIGTHKSEILAPIFQAQIEWRPWIRKAERLTREALQDEVNDVTGHGRAVDPLLPGERFYRALLVYIPEDAVEEVERVFALGKRITGSENAVAVFLGMVKEVSIEWEHRAAEKYR